MMKRTVGIGLAVALALVASAPRARAQEATDSVAHPIRTTCGVRLDPVDFLLSRADELGLDPGQRERLETLGQRLIEDNRPLGERFWALAGNRNTMTERSAILFELRVNYRVALGAIRQILTAEQWDLGFQPDASDERVRCLSRSIPVIIGTRS